MNDIRGDIKDQKVYNRGELDKSIPKWKKFGLGLLLIGSIIGALGSISIH